MKLILCIGNQKICCEDGGVIILIELSKYALSIINEEAVRYLESLMTA